MSPKKQDDFMKKVQESESGFPPAWKPESAGDTLVGTITGFDRVDGEYGPQVVAFIIDEDDDEERALYLSSTVLKNQFRRLDPKPGERVGIKYLGKSEGQSGRRYHNFSVHVDREEQVGASFSSFDDTATAPFAQLEEPAQQEEAPKKQSPKKKAGSAAKAPPADDDDQDDLPF